MHTLSHAVWSKDQKHRGDAHDDPMYDPNVRASDHAKLNEINPSLKGEVAALKRKLSANQQGTSGNTGSGDAGGATNPHFGGRGAGGRSGRGRGRHTF